MFWDGTIADESFLRKYTDQTPVPIASLARELGLEVKATALPPNISGEIRPSDTARAGYRITVNRHETKERQRFTIAHEITHFLKHKHLIKDGIDDNVLYRSRLSDAIEAEANRGAAMLLMPKDNMLREFHLRGNINNDDVIRDIANKFGVSLPAAKIRLGIN